MKNKNNPTSLASCVQIKADATAPWNRWANPPTSLSPN